MLIHTHNENQFEIQIERMSPEMSKILVNGYVVLFRDDIPGIRDLTGDVTDLALDLACEAYMEHLVNSDQGLDSDVWNNWDDEMEITDTTFDSIA